MHSLCHFSASSLLLPFVPYSERLLCTIWACSVARSVFWKSFVVLLQLFSWGNRVKIFGQFCIVEGLFLEVQQSLHEIFMMYFRLFRIWMSDMAVLIFLNLNFSNKASWSFEFPSRSHTTVLHFVALNIFYRIIES